MAKLWDKGYELNELIERFTVGNDYELDRRLVAADAVASIAHCRMLQSIGILTSEEADRLAESLVLIAEEGEQFPIRREDEDSHTAIEVRLTRDLGDLGKKIHTGRSRNDQVLASTRVFLREALLRIRGELQDVAGGLLDLAEREADTPMPGRTHLQPAMPSSVGLWAGSFAELLIDDDTLLDAVYGLLNRSPLGAAAGYGVPLPLDRELVAESLGFAEVHHNVIAVNNSRGKTEAALLDALDQVGLTLSRFAEDLILFSMPEFGYFTLPKELCSGSSIMPQKRNPDAMELIRARAGVLSSLASSVKNVVRGLPSGYNRDLQETKEPVLRAVDMAVEMLAVVGLTVSQISVNRDRLQASFTADLLATDEVFALVTEGKSFRDAYREVASRLDEISDADIDPGKTLGRRTSTGTPGNPDLATPRAQLELRGRAVRDERERIASAVARLVGRAVRILPAQ